ncbi:MAG: DUF4386 domain-containing protein [Aureispira sp.]
MDLSLKTNTFAVGLKIILGIKIKAMDSVKKKAKTAGLLYLLIAIVGGFSIGYVPSIIVSPDNATETSNNLLANQGLLQIGIIGDVFVFLFEIILTVILYRLFNLVNQPISKIAAFSRLSMSIVMGINLINYLIPISLLSSSTYMDVFEKNELDAFVLLFFNIHQYGIYVWGIFFGLHLIALGYLIFKSGYCPPIIGLLMMIGSFGYMGEGLVKSIFPNIAPLLTTINILLLIAVLGELSFAFWLLIKGINIEKWNRVNEKTNS